MAVAQGYGKIVTSGSVFAYDVGDTRNSYKGEPTVNLVPTPQHNANFTTSNGWSTYNTNQYNGAQYFSIGTIGSISNNIVTLSMVGRNIRSFDVLRAQTSGGGISAGTDYVIKKLSSNTFSLHEYNSSQNGSQGYINTSTGFFKVHDAYANDTRIAINETGFPTMWWGAPHLPNSGLIKEIISGGGRVPGTNAMRLHAYREDGVVDGMAYGVYCPVTAGDTITMSVWLKLEDNRKPDASLGYSTYFGAGNGAFGTSFGGLTTEWQRFTATWTASVTYNFYSYWWPSAGPMAIDMCDFQVETNKGHPTPFVAGTRSATEGLIDLTGNSSIDLSNVSFDSNAQIVFDGTDDVITVSMDNLRPTSAITQEVVVYIDNNTTQVWIGSQYGTSSGNSYALWLNSANTLQGGVNTDGSLNNQGVTFAITVDKWYHFVHTYDGTTQRLYANGTEVHSWNTSGTIIYNSNNTLLAVGNDWNGSGYNVGASLGTHGKQDITKIYSRALTAAEVKQNYRHYKTRFNLS